MFASREISSQSRATIIGMIEKKYPEFFTNPKIGSHDRDVMIHHVLSTTDFRKPLSVFFREGYISYKNLIGNLREIA